MNASRRILKWICALSVLLVLYNECGVYFVSYLNWPLPHASLVKSINASDPAATLRLLLVADPQLIGEQDEPSTYGWLARWDSDRYLHNTYMLAHSYVRPHAVLFLGDLFDEGLKATEAEYARYFARFEAVFRTRADPSGARHVFISGDNDVGGEYYGDRTDALNDRFERFFGQPLVDAFDLDAHVRVAKLDLDRTVSFYNGLKRSYLVGERLAALERATAAEKPPRDRFMVILNHATLLNRDKREIRALSEDLNAALVIKGDSHKFYIAQYSNTLERLDSSFTYKENPSNFYILPLKPYNTGSRVKYFYELSVPTCSYRMGVPDMAYGMLTITATGKAYFSLLWLPSRFGAIFNYLFFMAGVAVFLAVRVLFKRFFVRMYRNVYRVLYKS